VKEKTAPQGEEALADISMTIITNVDRNINVEHAFVPAPVTSMEDRTGEVPAEIKT
jgi:hypothetical protein